MDKNLSNEGHYLTSNFNVSAFLCVKGLQLVDIDRSADSPRAQFVFLDSPKREDWVKSFSFAEKNSPEVMVDARDLVMAIKTLKDKLYQTSNDKP